MEPIDVNFTVHPTPPPQPEPAHNSYDVRHVPPRPQPSRQRTFNLVVWGATAVLALVLLLGVWGAVSAGPVVFADDFNRDSIGGSWATLSGDWRIINDRLTTITAGSSRSVTTLGSPQWVDYAVEFDLGTANLYYDYVEVAVRYQHDSSYMVFVFSRDDRAGWYLQRGGQRIKISGGRVPDRYRRMRVEVKGNLYRSFVDGQELVRVTDDSIGSGKVAVTIYCYGFDTCPSLDNFRVVSLQ